MKIKSKKESSSREKSEGGRTRLYEAMFLVDSADAASDWEGVNSAIRNILEKAGVEIVSMKKWDDRRLAYEISGKEKGTYILCYFKAEGSKIRGIERDVQLSEKILRVLILCAEKQGMEGEGKPPASQKESETEIQEDVPAKEGDAEEDAGEQSFEA